MKNWIVNAFLICVLGFAAFPQDRKYYYENAVYRENIKTVMMHWVGFEFSNPVLFTNEDVQLLFQFDDLADEEKDYYSNVFNNLGFWRW